MAKRCCSPPLAPQTGGSLPSEVPWDPDIVSPHSLPAREEKAHLWRRTKSVGSDQNSLRTRKMSPSSVTDRDGDGSWGISVTEESGRAARGWLFETVTHFR